MMNSSINEQLQRKLKFGLQMPGERGLCRLGSLWHQGLAGGFLWGCEHSAGTYKPFLPSFPDAAQTGQGIEPEPPVEENLPVEIEPEEMPDPAVIIDVESQENASDCFPDPADD